MRRTPTEADARQLFVSTGLWFKDHGNYFSVKCPYHHEKTASAALYKDRWLFTCFACGESRSFPRLYEDLKNEPWDEHGSFGILPSCRKEETFIQRNRKAYEISEGRITSVYDNAKALAYCRSREIDDAFMQEFDFQATTLCKFQPFSDTNDTVTRPVLWQDRLLIPINLNNKPYSLEGRDYTRAQHPKCLYPKGCKTDICFNQDALDLNDVLIVCEGLMDIHKIWKNITKNVTCTFGMRISDKQKTFLKSAKNLILYIDDDAAGHNSVSIFEKFMQFDFKVAMTKGKDPGDSSISESEYAITHAVNWVDWLFERVNVFDKPQYFSLIKK